MPARFPPPSTSHTRFPRACSSRVELFAAALSAELWLDRPGSSADAALAGLTELAGGAPPDALRRRAAPDLFPLLCAAQARRAAAGAAAGGQAAAEQPPAGPGGGDGDGGSDDAPPVSAFRAYLALLSALNACACAATAPRSRRSCVLCAFCAETQPSHLSHRTPLRPIRPVRRLLVTARQVQADADSPEAHPYLGHQLALLHHTMKAVRTELRPLRSLVEAHFGGVKEAADRGALSAGQLAWLRSVAAQVGDAVSRWPPSLAAEVRGVVKALRVACSAVPDD